MATSLYKYLTLMATGSETDNWGNVQNAQQLEILDRNLGGIVSKSLTNVNVTLTGDESQAAILYLVGTLTGNVQITTQCQGFVFVDNQTTGAFAVTIKNALAATAATLPQGSRVTVISDASNGCRIAGTSDFPSGTRMPFQQTAAPTGWTKDTNAAYNDAAIRSTTGTVGTGGSTAFSSVFTSRTIAQNNLPNISPAITINDPGHFHTNPNGGGVTGRGTGSATAADSNSGDTNTRTTGITATCASINGGVSQQAMDFAVKFCDMIIAVKN
jgi:hypothetical protein